MSRVTTHVLDTASGKPAAGMRIEFLVEEDGDWRLVKTLATNADGRTDEPLLSGTTNAGASSPRRRASGRDSRSQGAQAHTTPRARQAETPG